MSNPKEVLIITGTCAVGKTTTAKAWAKSKNGAIIECDCFTEWIFKDDFPHWTEEEEKFTANLSTILAFEYLNKDMSVAIDNVWSAAAIEKLRNELYRMSGLVVKSVRLICDLDENQRRDEQRIPENQMKERVSIVAQELEKQEWPSHIHTIDTTMMSMEEILAKLEAL